MRGRAWPVLVKPGKPEITVIFPDIAVMRGTVFILSDEDRRAHFKVTRVLETGANYAKVAAERAKELKASQELDFSSD